jgi:hypothetical protein
LEFRCHKEKDVDFDSGGFVIPTRQKVDFLFTQTSPGLMGAGQTFTSAVSEVAGYSAVAFLIVSDQPFQLRVLEAATPSGPFTQTASVNSTLDAASGLQKATVRVVPSGSFMRMMIQNLGGPQTVLQLSPYGLPL